MNACSVNSNLALEIVVGKKNTSNSMQFEESIRLIKIADIVLDKMNKFDSIQFTIRITFKTMI